MKPGARIAQRAAAAKYPNPQDWLGRLNQQATAAMRVRQKRLDKAGQRRAKVDLDELRARAALDRAKEGKPE